MPYGVGHGVIQNFRVVKDQETLTEAVAAFDCKNGLWIDHFASTRVSGVLEPSSLQVCTTIAQGASYCTIYAPTEYLLYYPTDYTGAIQFASKLLRITKWLQFCIEGVDRQAAKENLRDYLPAEEACMAAPTKVPFPCFHQALNYYSM